MKTKLSLLTLLLSFILIATSCVTVQVKDNTVTQTSLEIKNQKYYSFNR